MVNTLVFIAPNRLMTVFMSITASRLLDVALRVASNTDHYVRSQVSGHIEAKVVRCYLEWYRQHICPAIQNIHIRW